jgi:hypothetical protein
MRDESGLTKPELKRGQFKGVVMSECATAG